MRIKFKGKFVEVPTYQTATTSNFQQNATAVVPTMNQFDILDTQCSENDTASIADVIGELDNEQKNNNSDTQ